MSCCELNRNWTEMFCSNKTFSNVKPDQTLETETTYGDSGAMVQFCSISMPVDFCCHLVGKNSEKFVTVIALKYALLVGQWSYGHFYKLIQFYLNNTINLRHSTQRNVSRYTYKMAMVSCTVYSVTSLHPVYICVYNFGLEMAETVILFSRWKSRPGTPGTEIEPQRSVARPRLRLGLKSCRSRNRFGRETLTSLQISLVPSPRPGVT